MTTVAVAAMGGDESLEELTKVEQQSLPQSLDKLVWTAR